MNKNKISNWFSSYKNMFGTCVALIFLLLLFNASDIVIRIALGILVLGLLYLLVVSFSLQNIQQTKSELKRMEFDDEEKTEINNVEQNKFKD